MRTFLLAVSAAALGLSALGCGGSSEAKPSAVAPAPTPGVAPEPTPATPTEPPAYVVPPAVTPMNVSPIDTAPPPIIPVTLDTPAGPVVPQLEPPTIPLPPLPTMR